MIAITILSIINLVLLGALTLLARDFNNIKKQLQDK